MQISVSFESSSMSAAEITAKVGRVPTSTSPNGKRLINGRVRTTSLWLSTWDVTQAFQDEIRDLISWLESVPRQELERMIVTVLVSDIAQLSGEVFEFTEINRLLELGVEFDVDDTGAEE